MLGKASGGDPSPRNITFTEALEAAAGRKKGFEVTPSGTGVLPVMASANYPRITPTEGPPENKAEEMLVCSPLTKKRKKILDKL